MYYTLSVWGVQLDPHALRGLLESWTVVCEQFVCSEWQQTDPAIIV